MQRAAIKTERTKRGLFISFPGGCVTISVGLRRMDGAEVSRVDVTADGDTSPSGEPWFALIGQSGEPSNGVAVRIVNGDRDKVRELPDRY